MVCKETVDLENVLSKFKLSGPYYMKLFSLLIFSGVTNAFYSLNYVFAASDVQYRCKYSECENNSNSTWSPVNITLKDAKCSRYVFLNETGGCHTGNVDTSRIVSCTDWVYQEPNSFVEELGLECEDWKRTLVGTVHSFGYMIGLLITGPLADKIGRKKLIILFGLTAAIMGIGRSLTSSYIVYLTLELVEGLFGDTYSTTFTLGVEMVTKENRVTFITLMTASTSLAGILMAIIAWCLPYWRNFLRAVYAPSLIFLLYIYFLDESVRWLLIKGKKEEAKVIIANAAKSSKVNLNSDAVSIKCESNDSKNDLISALKSTFGSKKILLRFLACACMWITGIFNKYVLLINSVELEGNKYLNFGLTTFSELPASLALAYVLKKFKRKIPLIFSFVLTGVFCIGQSFVSKGNPWLSTSLFLVGKFMATISYATVYLYTSEIFPTYTRNTMHALCSSLGRIASLLAPQTPLLKRYWVGLPCIVVGGLSLLTSIIVVLLPETSEDILPDTARQAEAIGATSSRTVTPKGEITCTKF